MAVGEQVAPAAETARASHGNRPVVGILVDDSFDEWLESIAVTIDTFSGDLLGSWWFNYVQALQLEGVDTLLFCVSGAVSEPLHVSHAPTGATICFLPRSRLDKVLRRWGGRPSDPPAQSAWRRLGQRLARLGARHTALPVIELARQLRAMNCRLLLVEPYGNARFDTAVVLGRLLGVRVFGTFTSVLPPTRRFTRPLAGLATRWAAGFVVCARAELKRIEAERAIPADRAALIRYPVETAVWSPQPQASARARLDLPATARIVVYHGAIDPWIKGLDVLVDAWDRLCSLMPGADLRLIIIGSGRGAATFEELLAGRRLRGVNWIREWVNDRALLRDYLCAADVYAFPSRVDAFGIAVLEAMACGLPVVAAAAPAVPDILLHDGEPAGVMVPVGDSIAFADALHRVLTDDSLARRFGTAGRARVETLFSPRVVGSELRRFMLGGDDGAGSGGRR